MFVNSFLNSYHFSKFICLCLFLLLRASLVAQIIKNPPAMQERSSNPGSGRSPGEGNGYPLQSSCPENSLDRGPWWATSPWGHKKSDTIKQITLSLSMQPEKSV